MGAWKEARITGGFSLIHKDADGNALSPSPGSCMVYGHANASDTRHSHAHTHTHTAEYGFINTAAHKYRFCILSHQGQWFISPIATLATGRVCEAAALRQGHCAAVYVCCRVRRLCPQLTHCLGKVNPAWKSYLVLATTSAQPTCLQGLLIFATTALMMNCNMQYSN